VGTSQVFLGMFGNVLPQILSLHAKHFTMIVQIVINLYSGLLGCGTMYVVWYLLMNFVALKVLTNGKVN
jgi:drug/metabolite transporter (DMT)-like permease